MHAQSQQVFQREGELMDLIYLAQQGDLRAFNRLVLDYQDGVYSLACRLLCDPAAGALAAQQAFARAYAELPRYRQGSWRAWLYRCVVQACRNLLSLGQDGRQRKIPSSASFRPDLRALPFDLRLVLALVDLEELDYVEAAAVLGVSPHKVRRRLARARQLLVMKEAL